MPLSLGQLSELPSPYYRVAIKALIFNDQNELLVLRNEEGRYEIPGGGWEHGETIEQCVQRELMEEMGVQAQTISSIEFVFQGQSDRGWRVVRLVLRATLDSTDFTCGDGIVAAEYVSADTLRELDIVGVDVGFKDHIDQIWANR